jgi:hypothetical protein
VGKIETVGSRKNFAGISEQRALYAGKNLPPPLPVHEEIIVVVEPEGTETPKIIGGAESWLQIERHLLPWAGIGQCGLGAHRENALLIKDGHKLLHLRGQSAETKPVDRSVIVVIESSIVMASRPRSVRAVAQIQVRENAAAQEVALDIDAGRLPGANDDAA